VTVIIANSLKHALMMLTLVVGLSSVIAAMGWIFDWLRYAGAAYLVWLGWKLLRSPEGMIEPSQAPAPRGGLWLALTRSR
jgi:threonine/homoserine/homoserine lactone efflux protein